MSNSGGGFTNLRVSDSRHTELKIQAAKKGKKIFAYTDELLEFALKQDREEGEVQEPEALGPVKAIPAGVDIVL